MSPSAAAADRPPMTIPTRRQTRWSVLLRYHPPGALQRYRARPRVRDESSRPSDATRGARGRRTRPRHQRDAPESRSPQHRIVESHGDRGMVSALGFTLAAASELGALDRRQAPVRLPFEQFDPALQALAARHVHAGVNVGLKHYLLQTLIFHGRLCFVPPTEKNSRRTCPAFKPAARQIGG
jgi:hypothetical protein